jgi:hypothetical protein
LRTAYRRRVSRPLGVHHTDAQRELAYDRDRTWGRLDKALDDAQDARLDRDRREAGVEVGVRV